MDGRLASTEKHAQRPSAPRPGGQLLGHRPAGAPEWEERGSITPPTLRAHARDGNAALPGGPHDLGLAPRDPILPRPEDAQGVKLAPELDSEDGRVPPPANPLGAPRAFEPERSEDRVRLQTLFIHSSAPRRPPRVSALPCLLPPHYARRAIRATLTPFRSASHPGRVSQILPRTSGCVAFLVNRPNRVRHKLNLLERQGYGRAGFDLPRARLLAA